MALNDNRIIGALKKAGIDFDENNFASGQPFRDSNIDSLDVMSLFLTLEEAYGIKFSPEEAGAIGTPDELSSALDRKLAPLARSQ